MTLASDQQDIANAEAALTALGPLTSANFDQALQLLAKRRNAQLDIQKYQNEQFRSDAFTLINQIQSTVAGSDKVSIMSQFLRTFAEYIATETQTLEKMYTTVKSIVDAIPSMTGANG